MRALILAAGMGKRLSWTDGPKALVRLLGLPLVSRAILVAREAGIREFVVVVGYKADAIKATLGDGSSLGVKISYVENDEWERGNGVSVLKAEPVLGRERFMLLMADHILLPEIVGKVARSKAPNGVSMAVDLSPRKTILEEATKVLVEGRLVRAVGKALSQYNSVDIGVIACGGEIFRALKLAIERGREEVGDALHILAENGQLRAVKFNHPFWFDIDTSEDMLRARDALLKNLIKPEDGPVSRYLNRPISTRISAQLVKTGLTPNQMSAIVFAITLIAAYFLFLGNYLFLLVGGVLVQLASILDGCDGEIARLKFSSTRKGGWIDSVMDRYGDFVIIAALAYGQWAAEPGVHWWLLAIFALVGSYGVSYTSAAFVTAFQEGHPVGRQIPAKRDSRLLILAVAASLSFPLFGLIIVGLLGNAEVLRRLHAWS